MEIDDRWQTKYGDLEFDAKKFPDARTMVQQLHAMGFKVTVRVREPCECICKCVCVCL